MSSAASKGRVVVVSGPSGVGKSTIVKEVIARSGAGYSVSATTRKPRAGEVDGKDYRFVDRATFERMIENGELLEWAEVFGQFYGTPLAEVNHAIQAGRTIVLEIDIQGGLQVARKLKQAEYVLVLPPGDEALKHRLSGRGSEDEQSLARRLGEARKEIEAAIASGVYNHRIINDDLEQAVTQMLQIVQESK